MDNRGPTVLLNNNFTVTSVVPRNILHGKSYNFQKSTWDEMCYLAWHSHASSHDTRNFTWLETWLWKHPNLNLHVIHENDYWHQYSHTGKCIVANYTILLVNLYFAGIGWPNKADGRHTAINWRSSAKPLWHWHCIVITYHCYKKLIM